MNAIEFEDSANAGAQERLAATADTFSRARQALTSVIFGQDDVIEQTLITLLSGGHGLLIGVPGLAKTKLVETLGIVLGLDAKRVQFTPDLMPADITGSEVMEESISGERAFRFIRGPVFTQLLMADEINRASPRTQSALLQAMQEKHVTVAGARHDLPRLFHVLATQNPLEQEGTYPLPEAQLDRFLLQIDVGYPDLEAERRMLLATTIGVEQPPVRVCGPDDLIAAQTLVRRIPVGEKVVDAILSLVRSARPLTGPGADAPGSVKAGISEMIAWGPGPRASQALMLAVRARALLDGRFAPSTDDVVALAQPVLRHRMALNFSARAEGQTTAGVIARLCHDLF
ncbi:MAG: MoxR family ATPase [Alphaproteobacteria bacterium]|nr:MoxR family ATPase [Alphaproteobacteria bacterium]